MGGSQDLRRAKTKVPRDAYRADSQADMSNILNRHLTKAEKQTLPCKDWTNVELQAFMEKVAQHSSPDLQQVYRSTSDRRALKSESIEDHKQQWKTLNHIVDNHPHLRTPQQEAHCREAHVVDPSLGGGKTSRVACSERNGAFASSR